MSYEKILDLISECETTSGRYASYNSFEMEAFGRDLLLPQWNDSVGQVAAISYRKITREWYNSLSDGFSYASKGAVEIRSAYTVLKSVKTEAQSAFAAIEKASAEINNV